MCPSQQFSEGNFFFRGVTIYFFILISRVLCYQQMQCSRVNWPYSCYLEVLEFAQPVRKTISFLWLLGKGTEHYTLWGIKLQPFVLLNLKPKYCFKKISHKEKLHFFVSFSFERQIEVCENDPEQVFQGDIFAQTTAIPQWRARSNTVLQEAYYQKVLPANL